jgi:hypothetical protein
MKASEYIYSPMSVRSMSSVLPSMLDLHYAVLRGMVMVVLKTQRKRLLSDEQPNGRSLESIMVIFVVTVVSLSSIDVVK